jgi:hypothetical protein
MFVSTEHLPLNLKIQFGCRSNESKSEKLGFAMSSVAATLAKFSMDVVLISEF